MELGDENPTFRLEEPPSEVNPASPEACAAAVATTETLTPTGEIKDQAKVFLILDMVIPEELGNEQE